MKFIKRMYRAIVPISIRYSPLIAKLKTKLLGHNWIYDEEYYQKCVEGPAIRSAGIIAETILCNFKFKSIIDVGCGTGAILEALRDRGCEVFGLEYADAALKYCNKRKLSVKKFNLENDEYNENRTFDIAISTEVAEHLPESVADNYINLLTKLAKVVIITAALPGQGGTDHVNEQPHSYWIAKFQQRDFKYFEELSLSWRNSWETSGIQDWYYQNLMIFQQLDDF